MIKLTGLYSADDEVNGLKIVGNIAFLADGEVGLDIVDISDPNNPILLGNYDTPGKAYRLDVVNNIAYIADDTGGLQIIDISAPNNPTLLGSTPLTVKFEVIEGSGRGVEVFGDRAFVAAGSVGLDIIDVSDPTLPTILTNIRTSSFANNVTISGNTAFISHLKGMDIIDISNVNNPVLLSSYNATNTLDIDIIEDTAFLAFENGLDIVDISNLNNPTLISNYKTAGQGKGIEIEDNKAFIADGEAGLTVVDISDLNNPVLADDFLYYYDGFASNLELSDHTAYVSNWILGLEIIDISNPIDSNLLSNYDTGYARQTVVSENFAFIINGDAYGGIDPITFEDITLEGGLEIVDISDPLNPQFISYFESLGNPWSVTIRDNTAFIGDGAAGVTIVDISNLNNPTLISNFDTNGNAYRVELAEDTAFIPDDSNGIVILDISNLNNPTLINTITEVNTAYDIEVVNNIAFVNDANLGDIPQLKIFDVSDLNNPILLSSLNLESGAYDIAVEENVAAVADYAAGVHIIDISDLNNPSILSTYADYNPDLVDVWAYYAEAVKIVEDKMFVAYGGGGIHVVDISDISSPQQLYEDQFIPYADEIEISDNKAYISTQDKGVKILDVSEFLAGNSNNNAPTITEEISDQNVIVNSEFSLNIENNFTDDDGDNLTYTVENLPTWLTFDAETRTFSGIPTELETIAITVTVSDGKVQVSDTFNLNIKNVENPIIFPPITINNNLFAGAGDNIINNTSSNSNRVYSGLGNDTILAGENDRIFGGNGNDILDASQGNGGNRLFGGAGNDTLIAGDGNNILVGGAGADKFVIADTNLPTNYNLILDFETGNKVIIQNLNVTFADITVSNGTKGAELTIPSLGQEAIAIFPNLDANTLNNVNNFEIS